MHSCANYKDKPANPARRVHFRLGQTVATPGALQALEEARQHPFHFLARHCRGGLGGIGRARQMGK